MPKEKKKQRPKKQRGELSLEMTINLHKALHKCKFKQKAPKAIKSIIKFAKRNLLTDDVRIDTKLNQFIWSNGIRNVPRKVRVRMSRKPNEEEEGKNKFYTLVQNLETDDFTGLKTVKANIKK